MFKEKLLIIASPKAYIMINQSKMVTTLGLNVPVPIEIFPAALHIVE